MKKYEFVACVPFDAHSLKGSRKSAVICRRSEKFNKSKINECFVTASFTAGELIYGACAVGGTVSPWTACAEYLKSVDIPFDSMYVMKPTMSFAMLLYNARMNSFI